jgi:hypothetical protein
MMTRMIRSPSALGVVAALALSMPSGLALQEGATTRVSVMTGCLAAEIGLGDTLDPVLSGDGRFVAYASDGSLAQGASTVAWFASLDGAGNFGPKWVLLIRSPPSWQAAATGCSRGGGVRERFGMVRRKGNGRTGTWASRPAAGPG